MKRMKLAVLLLVTALMAACGGGAAEPATQPTAVPAQAQAAAPTAQVKATEPLAKPTDAPAKPAEPTPAPAAAQEQAPTGSEGVAFVEQTLRAQLAAQTWRQELTTDDAGKISQITTEYSAPDRLHLVSSEIGEIIAIGDDAYRRGPDGAWETMPAGTGAVFRSVLDPKTVEDWMKAVEVTSFKFVGAELLDGRPTWVYEYNSSTVIGDMTLKQKCRDWIGVADKLPYKRMYESDSLLNPGSLTKQTAIYSYPSQIKIEAPQ